MGSPLRAFRLCPRPQEAQGQAAVDVLAILARYARSGWLRAPTAVRRKAAAPLRLPPGAGRGGRPRRWGQQEASMRLRIYDVTIEVVKTLRPVVERVARRDTALADQLRRAAASVPLNV